MPPVGGAEHAVVIGDGAGERAAPVAEELAVEQRLGEPGAVDRDERPRRAAAPRWWIVRATSSLPVPLSPVSSTVLLFWLTASIRR